MEEMNRYRIAALSAVGAVLVAGSTLGIAPAAAAEQERTAVKTYRVTLLALSFNPQTIRAKRGDKVKFVWVSGLHNVVSRSGPAKVNSGSPAERDALTITLMQGTYRLVCLPHERVGMRMTIVAR
jgi:plastocyanin